MTLLLLFRPTNAGATIATVGHVPAGWLRRRRWAPGATAAINWDHPLAQGLIACHIFPGGRAVDIVAGRNLTPGSGGVTVGASALGQGQHSGVSLGGSKLTIPSGHPLRRQPPVTIAWVGVHTATPAGFSPFYGLLHNDTDSGPYFSLSINRNPNNDRLELFGNDNGSFYQLQSPGDVQALGVQATYVATVDANAKTLWQNGLRVANTGGTSVIAYDNSTATLSAGWHNVTNRQTNSVSLLGGIWSRTLTANEIALLHEDPWCFLADGPSPITVYAFAEDSTGTIAVTLGDVTSAASGGHGVSGTVAVALGDVTCSATGLLVPAGTVAATLGDVTASASGAHGAAGTVAGTLDPTTSAAAGAHGVSGAVAVTLDSTTSAATGLHVPQGTVAVTLDGVTCAAQGNFAAQGVTGIIDATLGNTTASMAGAHGVGGTIGATLAGCTLAATGVHGVGGDGASVLDGVTLLAAGVHGVTGTAGATLGVTCVATGTFVHVITGTIAATLAAVTITATGQVGALIPTSTATLRAPVRRADMRFAGG